MSFETMKETEGLKEIREVIKTLEGIKQTEMRTLRINYLKSRLIWIKDILLNLPLKTI